MGRRAPDQGLCGALVLAAALVWAGSAGVHAEDLTGYVEVTATDFESRETVLDVPVMDVDTRALNRRIYASFARRLFPRLTLWGGGTFDDTGATTRSDGEEFDVDARGLRPYFGLRRQTAYQYQQILWSRDQLRANPTGGDSVTTIRDAWLASFGWRRPRLPNVLLSLSRSEDRDSERRFRDRETDTVDLTATHQFPFPLRLNYRGSLSDSDDRIAQASVRAESHTGSFRYDGGWFDRRVTLNAEYSVAYRATELESRGGEVTLTLLRLAGLSARDETPLLITLAADPTLIDDDRTTGGAIDLGLPAPAEDRRPWGLGIELERDMTVNTLLVTVDRDVRSEVSRAFTWQVFTSANNRDWTPHGTVSAAPFDSFLRRFEVRFGDVVTRYVKLVVSPLTPAVPFAQDYPDILVTELDALFRTPIASPRSRRDETTQTAFLSTRVRLLAARELYYEGSVNGSESNRRDGRYRVSNGLSYSQPLNEVVAVAGRVAWEREDRPQGINENVVYAANLSATPVPRLRYNLSLSGRGGGTADEETGNGVDLFLYAIAELYEGVDVQVGVGRSNRDTPSGATARSTQVNATARIVPSSQWTVGLLFLDTTSEGLASENVFSRAAEVNAAYTPFPTIYAYGSYRRERTTGQDRNSISSTNLSWAPFPGGTLRLGINFNDTRRSDTDERVRVLGPSVRWDFNRRSYLQVAYQGVRDESEFNRLDNELWSATLRWGF